MRRRKAPPAPLPEGDPFVQCPRCRVGVHVLGPRYRTAGQPDHDCRASAPTIDDAGELREGTS